MNVYKSKFLSIQKQDNALVQTWTDARINSDEYRQELSCFMDVFRKHKPAQLLWDIKACTLEIPTSLDDWMGEHVLIPMYKKGIKNLSFTISDDLAVHRSIVTSLGKARQLIKSTYYANAQEALATTVPLVDSSKITQSENWVRRDANNFDVNLKIKANQLPYLLSAIHQMEDREQFVTSNQERYNKLTYREIQVLGLIAKGYTNKAIAGTLFIEESSVKTHRKHIKNKLSIQSTYDLYLYALSFGLI